MKTLKCALAFALTPFVWQLATAGPVEEVAAATRGFYDALNHADGDGVAKYLLPRGDSFPRNGTELEPEADTAASGCLARKASKRPRSSSVAS